ncbi:MAG: PQQ-binding-like beta-propeller repeat protein, partial [Planctomycetes bacterium]|nr:PQQ-binding-like beta-propeller repeat protein [Planctomycetota bacterium]
MDKRDCKRMLLAFLILCVLATAETWGSEVIDKSGIKGGLIVHIGCGDGRLTNGLRAGDGFLVHGLDTDAGVVQKARQRIRDAGVYGKVSIDSFDGRSLPYIDNVVNLIVAGSLGDVSRAEVMRVLVPGGVAMVGGAGRWSKLVKPASAGTDEWTHYLHDPSNNAVSHDEAVSIPYHLQWAGLPKWTRNHNHLNSYSAVVSSGGRIFSIVDEAVTHSVRYPSRWRLVARDAYNGVVLWKKPIGPWEGHLRKFRSGPSELPRRLVAVGDRVYVTPGYGKVAMALDAASGDVVRIYKGTEGTHEIIYSDGVLYLVAGEFDSKAYEEALDIASFSPPIEEKRIIAIDAASGRELWAKDDLDTRQMLPTTLCVNDGKVYFNGLDSLVCLDRRTGKVAWKVPRPVEHDRLAWSAPTLVVYKGVVLSAEGKHGSDEAKTRASRRGGSAGADVGSAGSGDSSITWTVTPSPGSAEGGELIAFGASDGRELWRCDAAFGYSSPPDLFVADGLVWVSAVPGMNETDVTEGRDPVTGKVKRRIDTAEVYETAHHHRCYRDRATDNFLLLGRTGVEFVDLTGEDFQRHYWIRGSCQYGVMPANGLLYLPGHSCGCYIQSKLNGFLALAPKRGSGKVAVNERNRLEKGPAYNKISNIKYKISNRDGWPMLRYDPARSGYTKTAVSTDLKLRWKARLGGKLT